MKNFSFLIFVLFFTCCGNNKTGLISEKKFTERFRDSMQKQHPGVKLLIKGDLEIVVKYEDKEFTHFLNNAYSTYKADPDSISSVFDMYLKSASELYKEELPLDKKKIIPVIKDIGYIDEVFKTLKEKQLSDKPLEYVFEKYNEKLIILYAEDTETGISYFTDERFKESGIKRDSLFPMALRNLDKILPVVDRIGDKGIYILIAGGNYEASLILFKSIWTNENLPVEGKHVIAIPARDLLFVTGSKNVDGIKKIREMAKESWESATYRLIPDLFIWNGEKFIPYD